MSGVGGAARRAPLLLALWLAGLAAAPFALGASPEPVVANTPADCGVRGSFTAAVPQSVAWEVLTDYDGIARFVSSMHASRMESDSSGHRRLRQQAIARFLLMSRRMEVLLELEETPTRRISFRDQLQGDFLRYHGEWRLSTDGSLVRVEYDLLAEPRSAMARALCRRSLRNTARELLEEVRAEMLRRATVAE